MSSSALVVVVAAPGGITAAARDVLRDWVTLDLIRPFLWVDSEDVDLYAPFGALTATSVTREGVRRVRLSEHLADQQGLRVLRLTGLSVAGSRPALLDPAVAGYLYGNLGGWNLSAVHLVLTRHGGGGWQSGFERVGWHTLVAAPEDAWSPAAGASPYLEGSKESEFLAHAASTLASIVGLWPGMSEAPFDAVPATGEQQVEVVRAFLRRLDTSAVSSRVRHVLTDLTRGLPQPRDAYGSCKHLQTPGSAADGIADAVMVRHRRLFDLELESEPQQDTIKLTAWQALKQFFQFLGAALRRAPGELLNQLLNTAATATSRAVQNALFGAEGSRYEVVTRGLNSRGLPPGLDELAETAQQVSQRSAQAIAMDEMAAPESSSFWMDVIGAGLMLADGGERVQGVNAVQVEGRPGVVPHADWVAPDPSGSFVLPAEAAVRVNTSAVPPHDLRLVGQAAEELGRGAGSGVAGTRSWEAFSAWQAKVDRGFTARIGRRIVTDLQQRTLLVRQLLERLLALQRVTLDQDAVRNRQRRAQNLVRNHAYALLGVLILALVLHFTKLFSGLLLAGLAAACVLVVLISFAIGVVREQRMLHKLLSRQHLADAQAEVTSRNLARVSAALYASTLLYRQYLAWVPVLGRLVREPFGSTAAPGDPLRLVGVLPRAVGFGIALPDDGQVEVVAHDLGSRLYRTGWLDSPWQALLADAPNRLGRDGLKLRDNPAILFQDHASSPSSLLVRWSDLVCRDGVADDGGEVMWRQAQQVLRDDASLGSDRLLKTVEWQAQEAHGVTGAVDAEQFMSDLTRSISSTGEHRFHSDLFDSVWLSQGARVRTTIVVGQLGAGDASALDPNVRVVPAERDDAGLDRFFVVVQASRGLPSSALTLRGGAPAQPTRPDDGPDEAPPDIVVE